MVARSKGGQAGRRKTNCPQIPQIDADFCRRVLRSWNLRSSAKSADLLLVTWRLDGVSPYRGAVSLFRVVARSVKRFSQRGNDVSSWTSPPERNRSPSGPTGDGNIEFTIFIMCPAMLGKSALPMIATRVDTGIVSAGTPCRQAVMILAAARSALIEPRGSAAEIENQVYSAGWLPLNFAWMCEPVRINPGATVVT